MPKTSQSRVARMRRTRALPMKPLTPRISIFIGFFNSDAALGGGASFYNVRRNYSSREPTRSSQVATTGPRNSGSPSHWARSMRKWPSPVATKRPSPGRRAMTWPGTPDGRDRLGQGACPTR